MKTDWPILISDLLAEHRLSERRFCDLSGLNRSTVRRFLQGQTGFDMAHMEAALAVFGYELDAIKVRDVTVPRRPPYRKIREKLDPPPQPVKKRFKLIRYAGKGGLGEHERNRVT